MYDVAREQAPDDGLLAELVRRSAAAGYNALGIYLEHRFAYPLAPFAAGVGCLTPARVRKLQPTAARAGVRLIPFLNTLGHMEGFVRVEGGQWLAEGAAERGNAQICPSRPECVEFVERLIADALDCFTDEWIHLGGDEAHQLGQCSACAARAADGGVARLYAEHYARLCRFVLARGRRPCLWSDMLLKHPTALDAIPRETLIFDWHYDAAPDESAALFRQRGFEVVVCPAVHSFDSAWCHLGLTQRNIDEHTAAARRLDLAGVLVTTWEYCNFSEYGSLLPLVWAAGRRLSQNVSWNDALVEAGGEEFAFAARLLSDEIPAASALLRPGQWRRLREHLVMRHDPFDLWCTWREEACGPVGDRILALCEMAAGAVPADHALQFPIRLHRVAVEWVRQVEYAAQTYRRGELATAADALENGVQTLVHLKPHLEAISRQGGSAIDPLRLEVLTARATEVVRRVRALPPGARPAFEILIHPRYVPGDQAAWAAAHDAWSTQQRAVLRGGRRTLADETDTRMPPSSGLQAGRRSEPRP